MSAKSQSIFNQLDAGIRFLDIRFGINAGQILLYHGASSSPQCEVTDRPCRGRLAQ